MLQRENSGAAVQVHRTAGSTAITFSNSADGRRAMSRHLAMLGTTGVAIRRAEAGVRGAVQQHRRNQETHRRGWAGLGSPSLASSRASVREAVQQLRWHLSRIDRPYIDDVLVYVLDADGCSADRFPDPIPYTRVRRKSGQPFDWRFDAQTTSAMDRAIIDGLGTYRAEGFRLVRVPVGRDGVQRGFAQ